MRIQFGFDIVFDQFSATPTILMLSVHPSRVADLVEPQEMNFVPPIPARTYTDRFGNICTRIVAPSGQLAISSHNVANDSAEPDSVAPEARQVPVQELPDDALEFLLGSRYCETDRLSDLAWSMFGKGPADWRRVQAICTYVHDHLQFSYPDARPTRTACEGYQERLGVCRDFAHLAISFCRCMNIPARYCTGYLGDIGVPPAPDPMDFSAWFEAYLGDRWYAFDARHNTPRIGRILMARGRDAADVAFSTSFGPSRLTDFKVITEEKSQTAQKSLKRL
jgi:transglutaminase-like putative cysteine protease